MAFIYFTGFENGATEPTYAASGTREFQSIVVKTGSFAFRSYPTTTATGSITIFGLLATGVMPNTGYSNTYSKFSFRYATKPASASEPIYAIFTYGGTLKAEIRITSTGVLTLHNSAGTLVATGATVLSADTWYRIELYCGTGAVSGPYEVKINGVSEFSGTTNLNASVGASFLLGKSTNRNGNTVDFFYDDFIVSDSSFPGDLEVKNIYPISNGSTYQLVAGTGSGSYLELDEVSHDSDTTYGDTSGAANQVALVRLQTLSTAGIVGVVKSLRAIMFVKETSAVTSSNHLRIRSGATNSDTTAVNKSTSYTVTQKINNTDPATSLPWTLSAINSVEIGMVEDNAVVMRCTQLVAAVLYDPNDSYGTTPELRLKTEKHFIVKLKFKKKTDASEKILYVSDRTFIADALYSGSPEVIGILEGLTGFGYTMGEALSKISDGTISIKNIRGTLAYHLRMTDLLDDYILLNQEIVGYSFQKARETIGIIGDLITEFTGKVSSYSFKKNIFSIDIEPRGISNNIINKKYSDIASSSDLYPSYEVLEENINNFAPIIFGSQINVIFQKLLRNKNSGIDYGLVWGIATKFTNFPLAFTTIPTGSNPTDNFYTKNQVNQNFSYPVKRGDDGSPNSSYNYITPYRSGAGDASEFSGSNTIIDGVPVVGAIIWFFPIQFDVTAVNLLLTLFKVRIQGQNDVGLDVKGSLKFQFGIGRETADAGFIFEAVQGAYAEIAKQEIKSAIRDSVDSDLYVYLQQPAILDKNKQYYLRLEETGLESGTRQFQTYLASTAAPTLPIYYQIQSETKGDYILYPDFEGNCLSRMLLWGYSSLETTGLNVVSNSNYELYNLTPLAANATSSVAREREAVFIDLIADVDGYQDDSSGTITGTNNLLIEKCCDLIKFLLFQLDGDLDRYDNTRFITSESLSPALGGVEYQPITYRDLLISLCEAGASALIENPDGTLSYWTYGEEQEVAAIISERDCQLESFDSYGLDGIMNSLEIAYQEKNITLSATEINNKYYGGVELLEDADSIALYEKREADKNFTQNKWIQVEATAENYLAYKIAQYAFERFEIKIKIPFWKFNYREIKIWDLITLNHLEVPSADGSQPPNQVRQPGPGEDWSLGDVLRHAKSATCRVVARSVNYNIGKEPEINLTLRTMGQDEIY